jgi:hypothetical protein
LTPNEFDNPLHLALGYSAAGCVRAALSISPSISQAVMNIPDDLSHGPLDDGKARAAYLRACYRAFGGWEYGMADAFAPWLELIERLDRDRHDAVVIWAGENVSGGDWNNSRLFDLDANLRKKGQLPFGAMFFTRARDAGWYECHGAENEERSYLKPNSRPHQLDHLFCAKATYEHMRDCNVRTEWIAEELSDHAPLVTDFSWD